MLRYNIPVAGGRLRNVRVIMSPNLSIKNSNVIRHWAAVILIIIIQCHLTEYIV